MQKAREKFRLARETCCRARAALAPAHPREAALLLLSDAASVAGEIADPEDRSLRAAGVAELQASCGDFRSARATLEDVSEPADRAGVRRQLAFMRALAEKLGPEALLRELEDSETDDWNHDEILLQVVEERCRRGDRAGAEPMLAAIEDAELAAQGQRSLALLETHGERFAEALAIAEQIEHPRWSSTARCDLALAQAARGPRGALATTEGI
jgi:hypothetical protein